MVMAEKQIYKLLHSIETSHVERMVSTTEDWLPENCKEHINEYTPEQWTKTTRY